MARRLGERQYRRGAGVRGQQEAGPLVAGPGTEHGRETFLERGPVGLVVPCRQVGRGQPQAVDQFVVERPFQRTDRDVAAVGGFVDLVVGCAGVGEVRAGLVAPAPLGEQPVEQGREQGGAVHHGRVHHLASPVGTRVQQSADHTEREQHPAAAEVADETERWYRPLSVPPKVVQGTGEGDVRDVMAGGMRKRALLPPAGHPGVDQPRVAGKADVWTQPKAFHDPGPESFDQRVRALRKSEQRLGTGGALQVESHRPPAAVHGVSAGVGRLPALLVVAARGGAREPIHPDDIRAHVGEQHRPERRWAQASHLQHPHARERPGHERLPSSWWLGCTAD